MNMVCHGDDGVSLSPVNFAAARHVAELIGNKILLIFISMHPRSHNFCCDVQIFH